jgi:hypothetical protein
VQCRIVHADYELSSKLLQVDAGSAARDDWFGETRKILHIMSNDRVESEAQQVTILQEVQSLESFFVFGLCGHTVFIPDLQELRTESGAQQTAHRGGAYGMLLSLGVLAREHRARGEADSIPHEGLLMLP